MEITQDLNIPQSVISRASSRFISTRSVDRQPGQVRRSATTASEDGFLSLSARRNREATTRDLVSDLQTTTGTRISRSTAARRLNECGLYATKPIVCVPLIPASKGARLNCCRCHVQGAKDTGLKKDISRTRKGKLRVRSSLQIKTRLESVFRLYMDTVSKQYLIPVFVAPLKMTTAKV